MNGGKRPLGYTIIEVMIVLAVSGVMFLIASTFINGKQQRTAFTAGVNEMAGQVQDLINQIQSGKYSDYYITCSASNGLISQIQQGTSDQQGQNSECIFLGKIMHFSVASTPYNYETIPIAGSRLAQNGSPSVSLGNAADGADAQAIKWLITSGTVPQQLEVRNISTTKLDGTSGTNTFAFGFIQSQGTASVTNNQPTLLGGAQTINLYYASAVVSTDTQNDVLPKVKGTNLVAARTVNMCVTDGVRYAEIRVGSSTQNSKLNVTVKFDENTKPVPPCL